MILMLLMMPVVTYHINHTGGPGSDSTETFTIEPNSGHIKLAQSLDSVQKNHYRLLVKAQDESDPPKFDTAEVSANYAPRLIIITDDADGPLH